MHASFKLKASVPFKCENHLISFINVLLGIEQYNF